jgi:alkylated DNA repair dioxygenase AlkB
VQHFGYLYDYRARAVTADTYLGILPDWLETLAEQLVTRGYFVDLPHQVIANEYLPIQGISAHVDSVPCFDDTIISISLLSQCEMIFRERSSSRSLAMLLHPHSGMLLKGASRYDWTHEIPARKSDVVEDTKVNRGSRISLTFRKLTQAARKPFQSGPQLPAVRGMLSA